MKRPTFDELMKLGTDFTLDVVEYLSRFIAYARAWETRLDELYDLHDEVSYLRKELLRMQRLQEARHEHIVANAAE